MRRVMLFAVNFLVIFALGSPAQPQQITALELVSSTPTAWQMLAPEAEISLEFNYPLDCETAAAAIALIPEVNGTVECDDAIITFVPAEAYAAQTLYTLRILPTLMGENGAMLEEAIDCFFYTGGALQITEVLPANDSVDIRTDTTITVVFDRPVVPLVIAEDMADLPQPLTFTPELAGQGEWVNTFIYTFTPDEELAPGTIYAVVVDGSLTAVDGARLAEPYYWLFSTTNPRLSEVFPYPNSVNVCLDMPITLSFNMPMDRALVETHFALRSSQSDTAVAGTFAWDETDGSTVTFTPDDLLELDTLYVASLNIATLVGDTEWTFTTLPYPELTGTAPPDGGEGSPGMGFSLVFNTYMDEESINERVTVTPEPEQFVGYVSGMQYYGSFAALPRTTYTIRVEAGIADIYGHTIETPIEFSYTTRPYNPTFYLNIPYGPVGFYNAYNEETALYVIHRNVNRLGVQLYTIPTDFFADLLLHGRWDEVNIYNYTPSPDTLLREWRVDMTNIADTMLPSLLTFGQESACAGGPETALKVGDIVTIHDGAGPVQALNLPVDGLVTATFFAGFTMPIVGGPTCAADTVWWLVEVDHTTAWIPERDSDGVILEYVETPQAAQVEVGDGDGDALTPGVYFVRVNMDDPAPDEPYFQSQVMMVLTANLVLKTSFDSLTVWATDVQTGAPIANAPVTIYGGGGVVAGGLTDADGLLTIPMPEVDSLYYGWVAVLQTTTHLGIGATSWADGIDPGMFGLPASFHPIHYTAALYTDRRAYRPGETVYFRGIVRRRDDMTYTPPTEFDSVLVSTSNGVETITREYELTPFGTFSGEIELSENAELGGYYTVGAYQYYATDPEQTYFSATTAFSVAEFRLPEFQVNVNPEQNNVAQGDPLRVVVAGEYYSGGAVSNARVDYQVIARPFSFRYTGPGRYNFYDLYWDYGGSRRYSREIVQDSATTGADGSAIIEIPTDLGEEGNSQQFTIEATLFDESNQTVSGRALVNVHAGEWYIGTRPERYVGRVDEDSTVNMILVDWESNSVPNEDIAVQVVQRRWYSVREQDSTTGHSAWVWEVEDVPITEGALTTGADGRASFTFTPEEGGTYRFIFTTHDSRGNEIVGSAHVWISGPEYVSWRQSNNNRIELFADQEEYSVGDTAKILIASPFQGITRALITVERYRVIYSEVITMENNSFIYELPIEPDFAPNVFVSVMLIKGVDETNPVAAFRMGMIQLPVNTEQKLIHIELDSNTDTAGPQETVTYTIRTTDYHGEPVQAEVGVALTDAAALAVSPPPSLESNWLLAYFYSEQGISVRTSTPLTVNVDQITHEILDVVKGGGGGLEGLPELFPVRGNFISTPYFDGTLVTDETGFATFTVTLPDNLTTWTLSAHAVTSGADGLTLVGQASYDIISTRPLLVRPVTPRFMVVGDRVVLAAVIHNNSGRTLGVHATLESQGVTLEGDATQTVIVPADGRVRVDWPALVADVDAVELIFSVVSIDGRYNDASRPPLGEGDDLLLPVYRYEAPETVGTAGMLSEPGVRTEVIALPQNMIVTEGELTVRVQPSLAATTIDGLNYLQEYPYYCIEQTVSRFLPNIITYRTLERFNLADAELEANLTRAVEDALQRLYAEQKADGGWGWYLTETSHPITTAYALIGLVEAQAQGFAVDPLVIARAGNYLAGQLIVPGLDQPNWRLNRQAFILYALARAGIPDIGQTANLFEYRDRLNQDARAFLTLALHIIDPASTLRTDALLADFYSSAIVHATGTHWEESTYDWWNWSTDVRTTALVLEVFVTLDPESELIPNIVRWLVTHRQFQAWSTTQETAWSVMALSSWMWVSGELAPDYEYSVLFNDELLLTQTVTPETVRDTTELVIEVQELLTDQANRLQFGHSVGNGVLYYTAHLRPYLPVPEIGPLNRGITIERHYTHPDDENRTEVTEARVGEIIQVRLTIIAPNALHYVIIEDPIPAGTEAINPGLSTSQQIGTRPSFTRTDWGWGWWWFSDIEFRDEKVVLSTSYLPAGVYEFVYTIRAGIPGVYNVIPTTGQEFYFPEIYGRSAGSLFTIVSE